MSDSNHHVDPNNLNSYHLEGDVWTHTMMVCKEAEPYHKCVQIACLLHDIGKPISRQKAYHKTLQKDVARFSGHEGVSFFMAIDVLKKMEIDGLIDAEDTVTILKIINSHGRYYSKLKQDGNTEKYIEEIITEWSSNLTDLEHLLSHIQCDVSGRFATGGERSANMVSDFKCAILTSERYANAIAEDYIKPSLPTPEKENNIVLLIGPPGAGKSTWIEKNVDCKSTVISRDSILRSYLPEGSYSEAWEYVSSNNLQKEVDRRLQLRFHSLLDTKQDVYVDMTNMSKKSRRKWLQSNLKKLNGYNRKAIVFATSFDRCFIQNSQRSEKCLDDSILLRMMQSFLLPLDDEVDSVEWLFNDSFD